MLTKRGEHGGGGLWQIGEQIGESLRGGAVAIRGEFAWRDGWRAVGIRAAGCGVGRLTDG
jgi:hypothetical protein